MTMTDPIADMLTRIRNAQQVKKSSINMPSSGVKEAIAKVLVDEGFVAGYSVEKVDGKSSLLLDLKYFQGEPVISQVSRVSKPGLRVYKQKDNLPKVKAGLGVAVISTSKGVMSDKAARSQGLGGEVLFYIS